MGWTLVSEMNDMMKVTRQICNIHSKGRFQYSPKPTLLKSHFDMDVLL